MRAIPIRREISMNVQGMPSADERTEPMDLIYDMPPGNVERRTTIKKMFVMTFNNDCAFDGNFRNMMSNTTWLPLRAARALPTYIT